MNKASLVPGTFEFFAGDLSNWCRSYKSCWYNWTLDIPEWKLHPEQGAGRVC